MNFTSEKNEETNISIHRISKEINDLSALDGSEFYIEIKTNDFEQHGLIFKGLYLIDHKWVFSGIDHLLHPIAFSLYEDSIINVRIINCNYTYTIITNSAIINIYLN